MLRDDCSLGKPPSPPPPSSTSPPASLDSEQRRGRAILEILETEQSYQRQLGDFIGFFLRDLESGEHEQARAFMSIPNLAALCSNMEQIFHVSHQFCAELQFALNKVDASIAEDDSRHTRRWARISIGPIFCRFSSLLTLYEQYVENHGFGKFDIARFSANPSFQQFWQRAGDELRQSMGSESYRSRRGTVDSVHAVRRHSLKLERPHSLEAGSGRGLAPRQLSIVSLEGYLILPIQRIPRYALLLKEIEKLTNRIVANEQTRMRQIGLDRFYERELTDLSRACTLVGNAAAAMNEAMRRSEASMDTWQLQNSFVNKVDLVECDEGRVLVREGELRACLFLPPSSALHQQHRKAKQTLYLHLLSDRILFSQRDAERDELLCLHNLPLESMYVEEDEKDACVFHLFEHLEHTLLATLHCESAHERQAWLQDIARCIHYSSKCELPVDGEQCPLCLKKKFISWWCKRCGLACCSDCSSRKRMLADCDEPQRCCDLCRLEIDLTPNEEEPYRFRLLVTVHSSLAKQHNAAGVMSNEFFSLTPRDDGGSRARSRLRGPSTLGHAACFSIPIGPSQEVEEEERSRFWVLHAFSGTSEIGHVTLDVEQLVCSKQMFTELYLDQAYFALVGGGAGSVAATKRSVSLSFQLLLPPALFCKEIPSFWGSSSSREETNERQAASFSSLLASPGGSGRSALPIEHRALRFAPIARGAVNGALLVHYERMAKDRPSKFSILCVKYLYVEIAKRFIAEEAVLRAIQERDVRFDEALDKSIAHLARAASEEEETAAANAHFLSNISPRALHFFECGAGRRTTTPMLLKPREAVLNDLISTEQRYVSSLKLLNEVFVTPLIHLSHGASVATLIQSIKLQRGGGRWLQTQQDLQLAGNPSSGTLIASAVPPPLQAEVIVLLQCMRQILSVNHHLLTELQLRCKESIVVVGDVFKRFTVVLKVYIAYLANHAEVERLVSDTGGGESAFALLVKYLEQDVRCLEGNHTFLNLLRLPKDRLTRYKRFLLALLMHTAEEHADAELIRDSLRLLDESEQHISWSVRRKSNMEKLAEIQRSFCRNLPLQQKRLPQLVSARRWFVREGDLVKRCRRDDQVFHFWLFNDALVYGERMGGGGAQYRFCRMLDLRSAQVVDLVQGGAEQRANSPGDARFAFEIRSASKSFVCMLPLVLPPPSSSNSTPASAAAAAAAAAGSAAEMDVSRSARFDGVADDELRAQLKQEWINEMETCIAAINEQTARQQRGEEEAGGFKFASPAPVVMQYEAFPACMSCNSKFSLALRRHHCRRCGAVVCHFCSRARIVLDNLHSEKKQRVCVSCMEEMQQQQQQQASFSSTTTSGASGSSPAHRVLLLQQQQQRIPRRHTSSDIQL